MDMELEQAIESNDIKTIALMHSGVPALEQAISEYLEKYAYPMKIAEAIEEFKDIIDEKKMRNSFTELLKYDEECLWQDKRTYNCSPKVHNSASSLG